MIWKKNIYDSLTGCAIICNEFATECSNSEDITDCYRSIILNLDCADICRQVAMLYVRGSENARLLAKACIEICEKCANELCKFDTERSQQVYALCKQTICSCVSIIEMGSQADLEAEKLIVTPSSLFYSANTKGTLYN